MKRCSVVVVSIKGSESLISEQIVPCLYPRGLNTSKDMYCLGSLYQIRLSKIKVSHFTSHRNVTLSRLVFQLSPSPSSDKRLDKKIRPPTSCLRSFILLLHNPISLTSPKSHLFPKS